MMRFFFLLVIILGMLIVFSCESYRVLLEKEYFAKAEQLYKEEKHSEALEVYKSINALSKRDTVTFRIIELLIINKDFSKAKGLLKHLSRKDKQNILVKELYAYWYLSNGNIDEAELRYKKILEEDKSTERLRVYANLAIIYAKKNNNKEALYYFRRISNWDIIPIKIVNAYLDILFATLEQETKKEVLKEEQKVNANDGGENVVEDKNIEDNMPSQQITINELNKILSILNDAYNQGRVDAQEIIRVAKKFHENKKYKQAFSLYRNINQEEQEDQGIALKINTYFLMTDMLFKEEYKDTGEQSFLAMTRYLDLILRLMYVNEKLKKKYEKQLASLINLSPTNIFKKMLVSLYNKYDISIDKEALLLNNKAKDSTEVIAGKNKNTDPNRPSLALEKNNPKAEDVLTGESKN